MKAFLLAALLLIAVATAFMPFERRDGLKAPKKAAAAPEFVRKDNVYFTYFDNGFCNGRPTRSSDYKTDKCYPDGGGGSFMLRAAEAYRAQCATAVYFSGATCHVSTVASTQSAVCDACNALGNGKFGAVRNCATGSPTFVECEDWTCLDCHVKTPVPLGDCTNVGYGPLVATEFGLCDSVVATVFYKDSNCTQFSELATVPGNRCLNGTVFGVSLN
jgi:hypothetical protein